MKPRIYEILTRALEQGIDIGYMRAHKHTETPDRNLIKDTIYNSVLEQIGENFIFDREE